jgi:type II secretory pathway component PulF
MADPYQEALNTMISLGAERVLVLQGPAPLKARLCHGFEDIDNWSDQISLGVLERSLQGEPILLADIKESSLAERFSVQISGICSVVCLPFWSPSSRILGLLYADTKSLKRAFSRESIAAMQRCARMLEQALYGGDAKHIRTAPTAGPKGEPVPHPGVRLGLRRVGQKSSVPTTPVLEQSEKMNPYPLVKGRAPARSVAVFFRSLAVMMKAGLPLDRSLSILSKHESNPSLRQSCQQIHHTICSGNQFSVALKSQATFQQFDWALVEVGERSGSLDRVLLLIAEMREKSVETQMRLQSSLAYPALLSLFSLAALVLAPPLVLRGQFELMKQSGQTPPILTQLLVQFSDLLVSPAGFMLLSAITIAGIALLRECLRRESWQNRIRERLVSLPVIGTLMLHCGCALFAKALAITYKVGLPVHQGLELAGRVCAIPQVQRDIPKSLLALENGKSMAKTLAQIELLPISFLALVAAGEECGKLDSTLEWVARFYEAEFEANLESVLSMVQPILILLMGTFIGGLLLATLMPMVSLLEQL